MIKDAVYLFAGINDSPDELVEDHVVSTSPIHRISNLALLISRAH